MWGNNFVTVPLINYMINYFLFIYGFELINNLKGKIKKTLKGH